MNNRIEWDKARAKAERQGATAFKKGFSATHCPYPMEPRSKGILRQLWLHGWLRAKGFSKIGIG